MRSTKRTQYLAKTLSLLLLPLLAFVMIWTGISMGCQISVSCVTTAERTLGTLAPWVGWGGVILFLLSPCITLAWLLRTHSKTHVLVYKIYAVTTVLGLMLCVTLGVLDYFFAPPEWWNLFIVDGVGLLFMAIVGVVLAYPFSWMLAGVIRYIQRNK